LREARAGQGGRSGRPFLWCRERGRFIPLGLRPSRVGSISRRHRSHREPGNEGALPLLSCESRRSALMNRDQGSSRFPGGESNAASASASSTRAVSRTVSKQPLQDPTKKFPKPPFAKQSQPWPGLASKMEPRPDHGEKKLSRVGALAGPQSPDHRR
jgi:hypothetical protein